MRRYWFLSVSFLNKSVLMLLLLILQEVSRKGMDWTGGQVQVCVELLGVVWEKVNLMLG